MVSEIYFDHSNLLYEEDMMPYLISQKVIEFPFNIP